MEGSQAVTGMKLCLSKVLAWIASCPPTIKISSRCWEKAKHEDTKGLSYFLRPTGKARWYVSQNLICAWKGTILLYHKEVLLFGYPKPGLWDHLCHQLTQHICLLERWPLQLHQHDGGHNHQQPSGPVCSKLLPEPENGDPGYLRF
jgi:hypothetical protein